MSLFLNVYWSTLSVNYSPDASASVSTTPVESRVTAVAMGSTRSRGEQRLLTIPMRASVSFRTFRFTIQSLHQGWFLMEFTTNNGAPATYSTAVQTLPA